MEKWLNIPRDELNEYIQYFSQDHAHYHLANDEVDQGSLKHYHYTEKLCGFIAWVSEQQLLMSNYMILLEQKNIHMTLAPALLEKIKVADWETLLAILTYCVRYERFCDGLWLICAKEGYFLGILKRLLELIETTMR